jgi:predicted  nucleic acid-binding Zn-ribbon protein
MNNGDRATKQAFYEIPETCPKVDKALEDAADLIKEQTGLLRDALVEAIERELDGNDRIKELEDTIEELKREIEDLKEELIEIKGD